MVVVGNVAILNLVIRLTAHSGLLEALLEPGALGLTKRRRWRRGGVIKQALVSDEIETCCYGGLPLGRAQSIGTRPGLNS